MTSMSPLESFPVFVSGDVIISLGSMDMQLHSQKLRDSCNYFATFSDSAFPQRFAFRVELLGSLYVNDGPDPTLSFAALRPVPNDGGQNQDAVSALAETDCIQRARSANEILLRLIYRMPIPPETGDSAAAFRDAACLAANYGCSDTVKDALVTTILKASLGTTLFKDDPWSLLDAAYMLRDGSIYSEALRHAAGNGDPIPNLVAAPMKEQVERYRSSLQLTIEMGWEPVMHKLCQARNITEAIAATMVRNFFNGHGAFMLGTNSLRPAVYNALNKLRGMDNGKALHDFDLMASLGTVEEALKSSQIIALRRSLRPGEEEWFEGEVQRIEAGIQQRLDRTSVHLEMWGLMCYIRDLTKHLFVGDRNVGYFTCVDFDGHFPWEDTSGA